MSIQKMLKQAQQLQAKMEQVQKELETEMVEASSGGGAVTVVMTGHQVLRSVKIQPEAAGDVDIVGNGAGGGCDNGVEDMIMMDDELWMER